MNNPILKDEYFEDAPRSGRPKIYDEETENAVIGYLEADRVGREASTYDLARCIWNGA